MMDENLQLKVVAEKPHHPLLVAHWTEMKKWWSIRCGVVGILLLSGLPALNDQFPNIAPSLMAWFPKHGQQWVPVAGAVLAILTRIVSQAYIADKLRQFFKVNKDGSE